MSMDLTWRVAFGCVIGVGLAACGSESGGGDDTGAGGAFGGGGFVGSGGDVTGAGGVVTGAGGVVTGAGGVVTGAGGEVTGAGGVVTGAGGVVTGDGGTPGTGGVPIGDGGTGFDACIASLTPVCKVRELDTAEKIGNAECKAMEFIPIPLTGGGTYGPMTIQGGPLGGKVQWNAGVGTPYANPVNGSEPLCLPTLIDIFAEPKAVTDDLKNTRGLDYSGYTIFQPACMREGEKYPVITWANGTCGLTHGYSLLLGTLSSYGYVVIASNSTWTNTAPTNGVQRRALDYAEALNDDPSSELYQRLDLDKIGAMGHSQGAAATVNAASDPRIKSLILWNTGTSSQKPFLNVSGDRDIGGSVSGLRTSTNNASQPGAWLWYHQVLQTGGGSTGHLVLMEQPDRVWEMTVAWWDWQLKGDQNAKGMFVGENCGLCNRDAEFEYGHNSLLQ